MKSGYETFLMRYIYTNILIGLIRTTNKDIYPQESLLMRTSSPYTKNYTSGGKYVGILTVWRPVCITAVRKWQKYTVGFAMVSNV